MPNGIIRRAPQADRTRPPSGIREGQDGLDVVRLAGVGVLPLVQRYLAGDEIDEPAGIGLGESLGASCRATGVDRPEYDGVLQDNVAVEQPSVVPGCGSLVLDQYFQKDYLAA
jgi:hypothetical protein